MAVGGSKLSEVKETISSLECGPGSGKNSPVNKGSGTGPGPGFKAPSRGAGKGSSRKGSSKRHSEE